MAWRADNENTSMLLLFRSDSYHGERPQSTPQHYNNPQTPVASGSRYAVAAPMIPSAGDAEEMVLVRWGMPPAADQQPAGH